MSSSSSPAASPAAADLAGIDVEPDNVPTKFLTILAAAITVVVVAMVFLAITLFDAEKAAQLEAKGYGDIDRIPVSSAQ